MPLQCRSRSKEGKYTGLRSTSNFVGGAIGAQPPPKLPKSPDSGDDVVEAAVGEPISMGTVTECTGYLESV